MDWIWICVLHTNNFYSKKVISPMFKPTTKQMLFCKRGLDQNFCSALPFRLIFKTTWRRHTVWFLTADTVKFYKFHGVSSKQSEVTPGYYHSSLIFHNEQRKTDEKLHQHCKLKETLTNRSSDGLIPR